MSLILFKNNFRYIHMIMLSIFEYLIYKINKSFNKSFDKILLFTKDRRNVFGYV
jgi:hypothetical protein